MLEEDGKALTGTHSVLSYTVTNVLSRVVSESVGGGLEVDGILPSLQIIGVSTDTIRPQNGAHSQVGGSQVGGSRDKLGEDDRELAKDALRELPRSNGLILDSERGESLLPAVGELACDPPVDVGCLLGELGRVRLVHDLPLGLGLGSLGGDGRVDGLGRVGDGKELGGIEAKLVLNVGRVVDLEGVAMDSVRSGILGSKSDGGAGGERTSVAE